MNAARRFLSLFVALVVALALPLVARAEDLDGGSYSVTYTSGGNMEDDYSSSEYASRVSNLQPGDSITFTVVAHHENSTTADWYLTNEVIKSLEEGDASGSAYGYKLTYEGPGGNSTLYESEKVGGTGSAAGLAEATSALDGEDFIYLDTLGQGMEGTVKLKVTLDGETEGNAYFNTFARVKLAFAVEANPEADPSDPNNPTTTTTTRRTSTRRSSRTALAKTGDPTSNLPLYLAAAGAGVLCVALAIRAFRSRRDDEGDQPEEEQQ